MADQTSTSVSRALVSVVIPAYRADDYLEATLDSILRQTYPSWEVIVVEDASEGETERIVERFAAKAQGHRVVYRRHTTNQGQAAARNTAIAEARGEFVALLDSDDLWLEGHLESLANAIKETHADIAYSTTVLFDSRSGVVEGIWGPTQEELARFPETLFVRSFITPSATLIRKSLFTTIGPFDTDPDLRGTEDLDFWLRCVREGVHFRYASQCGCLYRKNHSGAATADMAKIQPRIARTYERHANLPQARSAFSRWWISQHYAYAGHFTAIIAWRRAPRYYLRAWSWCRWRVDYLLLAACSFLLPILTRIHPKCARLRARVSGQPNPPAPSETAGSRQDAAQHAD